MNLTAIIFVCVILFLSGLLTGITSFGGNLFAIPLLTFVMGIKDAITFGCVTGMVIFLGLPLIYRRFLLWRELLYLSLGAIAGIPCGIYILTGDEPRLLMTGAGTCLLLFLIWQFIANRLHIAEKSISMLWSFPAGFFSAFMMASVGMGGPQLVLYAYLRKWGKENTIACANCAVFIQMFAIAPMQWSQGLTSTNLWQLAIGSALCSLVGIFASIPIIDHVNIRLFRAILLIMLLLSALMLLFRGLA